MLYRTSSIEALNTSTAYTCAFGLALRISPITAPLPQALSRIFEFGGMER